MDELGINHDEAAHLLHKHGSVRRAIESQKGG